MYRLELSPVSVLQLAKEMLVSSLNTASVLSDTNRSWRLRSWGPCINRYPVRAYLFVAKHYKCFVGIRSRPMLRLCGGCHWVTCSTTATNTGRFPCREIVGLGLHPSDLAHIIPCYTNSCPISVRLLAAPSIPAISRTSQKHCS